MKVALPVAAGAWRIARAILWAKALHAGPGVDQGAIDREMVGRQQGLDLPQRQKAGQKLLRHIRRKEAVTVVAEHRRMPHARVNRQADEPAKEQIVVDLLHQLPLASHRKERPQQGRPKQHLRRNRGSAHPRIKRRKPPVQPGQNLVRKRPDRPERMIRRNPLLQPDIAERPLRPIILPAHHSPLFTQNPVNHKTKRKGSFSAAC